MSRIFLSHSSRDVRAAVALKRWLAEQDPTLADDIFLDVDRDTGIPTGVKWRDALQAANRRCEAVICLMSQHWSESTECRLEYDSAMELHKQMFCARLEASAGDDLTAQWQRCDLYGPNADTVIDLGDGGPPVRFVTDGLQRLLKGVRSAGISADSFPWPPSGDPDRAPYRGWEPLAEVDAAVFFGRDAEIVLGLDELRGMRATSLRSLFVVLGPSGAGKSSFLRAGLIPRLRREDRQFLPLHIVRPERAALTGKAGLAHSIHATRSALGLSAPSLDEIARECLGRTGRVRELLEECQRAAQRALLDRDPNVAPPTLILPVDQAEELFTVDAGPQSAQFLALIAELADRSAGLDLIVVTTIRTDRYEAMQTAPELAGLQTVTFDDLKPMPVNHFKDVITQPAVRATKGGRRLQLDTELVGTLLADCNAGADTLPILSLTLARLYLEHGARGRITLADYRAMGGMGRVVETEIDDVLSADPATRRHQLSCLRSAFIPWLATINPENDQPMRRFARLRELPPESRPLIDALVAKRLMVTNTRADGEVVVEVALESLLRQWEELAGWLREQRQNLKAADDLERAARGWRANEHNADWLLEGSRLADAEALARAEDFRLRLEPVGDYLTASRYRETGRRIVAEDQRRAELDNARERQATAEAHTAVLRRRSTVLRRVVVATAVVAIIAVVGAIAAAVGFRQAVTARNEANANLRDAVGVRLVSEAQGMLSDTRPGGDIRALQQLVAARELATRPDDGAIYSAAVKTQTTRKIIDAKDGVISVDYSPDGTRVVSGGADRTVRLWDPDTGHAVGEPMVGHQASVQAVAFSPDGELIASASADRTVRLWDARTGKPRGQPLGGHTNNVNTLAFSPDGTRLVSGGLDGSIRQWDVGTGAPVGQPWASSGKFVVGLAFSPDGRTVASGGNDNVVRIWDATTGTQVGEPMSADQLEVTTVAFSPDGARLVSGGGRGTLQWWDVATRQPIGTPVQAHVKSLARAEFSRDGTRLATSSLDGTVRMWDGNTGQAVGLPMTGHEGETDSVAFRPDGHRLVSGSLDHTIRIWDADVVGPMTGTAQMMGASFSPDGTTIASVNPDRVQLWNSATGKLIRELQGPGAVTVAWSPDGEMLATSAGDAVRLWAPGSGEQVGVPVAAAGIVRVAFSPDGTTLATGGNDGTVRFWDVSTRMQLGNPIRTSANLVTGLAFSPDGRRLVTSGTDPEHVLRMWDVSTRQAVGEPMRGHTDFVVSVAFSPDGSRIVSGSNDRTLRVWDAEKQRPVGQPFTGSLNRISTVAYGPDGERVASSNGDGTIQLWDVATGEAIGDPLTGHGDVVNSVAFSPDGKWLVSAGIDNTVRLWPAVGTAEQLCDKMAERMTEEQWRQWVSPQLPYDPPCPEITEP